MTMRESFAHFGAVAANPRFSWSAHSPDGGIVVLNWWEDEVRREGDKLIYDSRNHPRLELWQNRLGNRDRIRNLLLARDNCGGRFRIVWCEAKDPNAEVRRAVNRRPDDTLWMKLTDLNEHTGEFRAESITD